MNRLPTHQNEPHIIDRLLAQRQLYSQAKTTQACQIVLTIGGGSMLAAAAVLWRPFEAYAALLGLAIGFAEMLYFEREYDRIREEATTIRDAIDRELFGDVTREILAGEGLHEESIAHAAATARREGASEEDVRNWYPPAVGALPLPLARLACQRANLAWDERTRTWYARTLTLAIAAVVTATFLLAMALDLSVQSLVLALLVPLAPGVLWGIREALRQRDAAKLTRNLNRKVVDLTNDVIQRRIPLSDVEAETRSIHQRISHWRRSVPPLPDRVYRKHRAAQENAMLVSTDGIVAALKSVIA